MHYSIEESPDEPSFYPRTLCGERAHHTQATECFGLVTCADCWDCIRSQIEAGLIDAAELVPPDA